MINRWFKVLAVDKPFLILPKDIVMHIKNNLWLIIICCVAVALQIYPIFLPLLIMGDETLHIQGGLLIYDYIDVRWHIFVQSAFWTLTVLVILIIKIKNRGNFILIRSNLLSGETIKKYSKLAFFIVTAFLFIIYFLLLRNIPYSPYLVRYPPVSKLIYFIVYSAFGIHHVFPRILQLIFHILCSVYLYRTINLFYEKDTALLGASIYLFLPVAFAYARLGETASGLNLFIIAISFYFIRYLKNEDTRDLLLTAYLIGIGFLYKDPILLMLIICVTFLIAHKKTLNLHSISQIKILSLSLAFIIPWMIISKNYNWRNYTFVLSNLTSLDGKNVNYFVLMSSNLSVIIFILFVLSVFYIVFFKRNILTSFFGLLFIVYYLLTVSDIGGLDPRLSLPLYPTVTVFLSLFITRIIQNIKWRHAYKLCFIILTIYLIIICTVPPLNYSFLTLMNRKLYYYPSEKAMKWVKENVKGEEKILILRLLPLDFYRLKHNIDKNNIIAFLYELEEVSTLDKVKAFYRRHNISYIMFPYGPPYSFEGDRKIIKDLKENQGNEFIEVEKFNLGENFIYIYKKKI